jgi:hypothetical protein
MSLSHSVWIDAYEVTQTAKQTPSDDTEGAETNQAGQ